MSPSEVKEYCAQHCYISDIAKKAVPRWAFISALSSMLIIAITVTGWYSMSLTSINSNFRNEISEHIDDVNDVILNADRRYRRDVERFIDAVRDNKKVLISVGKEIEQIKVVQGQIKIQQELVLKKVKLVENE